MRQSGRSRVLIRTQPLGHNYGGLMQAYALQTAIRKLGYEVDTDRSRVEADADRAPRSGLKFRLRRAFYAARPWVWPKPLLLDEAKFVSDTDLRTFARNRIQTVALLTHGRRPKRRLIEKYSSFVVGSDQVWRPLYSHVPSALFAFLPADLPVRRLSYAASFGTDDSSEYPPELRDRTRGLAQLLDAVSVREPSGAALAREIWGVDGAEWHVDPTMLLERSDYDELTSAGGSDELPIVSYVLDRTSVKDSVSALIEETLGARTYSLTRPFPDLKTFNADPGKFRNPAVESWLSSIRYARLLVTDSFHGCVFATLFHTPFIVVPNPERGLDRITTLLNLLDLQSRLVDVSAGADPAEQVAQALASTIDWDAVDRTIARERARGYAYLRENL